MEAHEQVVNIHRNSDHFAGMRVVTDSKPPITSEPLDQCVPVSCVPLLTVSQLLWLFAVILRVSLFDGRVLCFLAGSVCTSALSS